MAYDIAALSRLSQHFEKLPGIGRKTAQRLAFFVLSMPEEQVRDFADAMIGAKKEIHLCSVCQNITDSDVCSICSSNARDRSLICVVEEPKDVIAKERTRRYNGRDNSRQAQNKRAAFPHRRRYKRDNNGDQPLSRGRSNGSLSLPSYKTVWGKGQPSGLRNTGGKHPRIRRRRHLVEGP